jgi:hypothetical protein
MNFAPNLTAEQVRNMTEDSVQPGQLVRAAAAFLSAPRWATCDAPLRLDNCTISVGVPLDRIRAVWYLIRGANGGNRGAQYELLFPGDVIYVDTELYLSRGKDDFCGGLAEVIEFRKDINAVKPTPCVVIASKRQSQYNWRLLTARQKQLRSVFGKTWAHPDPDHRPEFNKDWH